MCCPAHVHVLDEAHLAAVTACELDQVHQLIVVDVADDHRIQLESREDRRRDASAGEATAEAAITPEEEDEGRARADETRTALESTGGLPAERQPAFVSKWEPVDEEELGVNRRQFLNRALLTAVGFSVAGYGATVLAFLWPSSTGGFGDKVNAGNLDDILAEISSKKAPFYVPEARTYIQPYPKDAVPAAKKVAAKKTTTGKKAAPKKAAKKATKKKAEEDS